jgi:hypothetical protein
VSATEEAFGRAGERTPQGLPFSGANPAIPMDCGAISESLPISQITLFCCTEDRHIT